LNKKMVFEDVARTSVLFGSQATSPALIRSSTCCGRRTNEGPYKPQGKNQTKGYKAMKKQLSGLDMIRDCA
jgi:hypothetical protein